jgi:hypothetical protein
MLLNHLNRCYPFLTANDLKETLSMPLILGNVQETTTSRYLLKAYEDKRHTKKQGRHLDKTPQ